MRIVVTNHLTLDGVMQSPAAPEEDPRGGFEHGGWAAPNNDEVMGRVLGEGMAQGGALLLGRRTYEQFYGFWPKQQNNPFTEVLNDAQKYVASSTLEEPLPWENSTLLKGDAADAVAELKQQPGKDIVISGSGALVRSLLDDGLIDELKLMVHPVVVGRGKRLFEDGGEQTALELVDSRTFATGVVYLTYRPAG